MTTTEQKQDKDQQEVNTHVALLAACDEAAGHLNKKFGGLTGERYFEASCQREKGVFFVKVTLRNMSGSFYYPVEGRVAWSDQNVTENQACHLLLDYIDLYFQEYLEEGGGVFLPIDWSNYQCEDIDFQLRGQILNLVAEKYADDLLAGLPVDDDSLKRT